MPLGLGLDLKNGDGLRQAQTHTVRGGGEWLRASVPSVKITLELVFLDLVLLFSCISLECKAILSHFAL